MSDLKHDMPRCDDCPQTGRYIAGWGDRQSDTAIVGTQPGDQHPDESECAFGMDLDWTAWSGEVLEDVFNDLDEELSDYYWTNARKCTDSADSCGQTLERELATFSKIILLGNETVKAAPEFVGSDVHKLWHPAYISRNRQKYDRYVRKWRNVLSENSPTTLGDFR